MKKLLSLVLVLSLVLGSVGFAFADFSDVDADDAFSSPVARLTALGIVDGFPDGTYQPEAAVTRAQYAKLVVAAMGLENAAAFSAGETMFSDVPATHWAAGYINVAYSLGLINGYPDGTFLPENTVSYPEALKINVASLGYTADDVVGVWPANYVTKADTLGLDDDVKVVNGPANRGAVAIMVDNLLFTPTLAEQTKEDDKDVDYDAKNFIEVKLGVDKLEGVVVGIDKVELDDPLDAGEVQIGDVTYNVASSDVEALLGYNVEFYADDEDVLYAEAKDNTVEEVVAEDVVSGALDVLTYEDADDEEDTYDITGAAMVYNGREFASWTGSDLEIESGMIKLVDVDEDDVFEYLLVTEYNTDIVTDADVDAEIIYCENDTFDLSDDDAIYTIMKDGEEIDIDDLDEDDVIEVVQAYNSELYFEIYVMTETVEGKVTEIDDNNTLYVDGDKYDVANDSGYDLTEEDYDIELGDKGVFTLDIDGDIIFFDATSEAGDNYAYVIDEDASTEGFDPYLQLKLLLADGTTAIYDFVDEGTFVDADGNETEVDLDNTTESGYVTATVGKVIQYKLDSDGDLSTVDLKMELTTDSAATFNDDTNKLDGYRISSETIIFSADDEDVYGLNDLEDDASYEDVTFIEFGSLLKPEVVLVVGEFAGASSDETYALVDKVTTAFNADDEEVNKLYALIDGEEVSQLAEDDGVFDSADIQGDLLEITYNSDGEIDNAVDAQLTSLSAAYDLFVMDKDSDVIVLASTTEGADEEAFTLADTVYIYTFDDDEDEVTVDAYGDIKTYESTKTNVSIVNVHLDSDGLVDIIVIQK